MRVIASTLIAVCLCACNGFVGEIELAKPTGPVIKIVDPEYVILRPVSPEPVTGSVAVALGPQTYYFDPAERIVDLRQLDPRTANIERGPRNTSVISIRTTEQGDVLLGAWTSANVGRQLGVFVDGRLISAPRIQSKITGMIVLDGDFTRTEAEGVLARLRRGGAAV